MTITEEYKVKLHDLKKWYQSQLLDRLQVLKLTELAEEEGISCSRLQYHLGKYIPTIKKPSFTKENRKLALEGHCQNSFGCSFSEFHEITGLNSLTNSRAHPLIKMWWHHKNCSSRAHQAWKIGLVDYAKLVIPYLGKFGRKKGAYVLGKKDKKGEWELQNLHVVTLETNSHNTKGYQKAHTFANSRSVKRMDKALSLLAQGLSIPEVAKTMKLSRPTISGYIRISRN